MKSLVVTVHDPVLFRLYRVLRGVDAAASVHRARNLAEMIAKIQSGRALDLVVIDIDGIGSSWPDRVSWITKCYPWILVATYGSEALDDTILPEARTIISTSLLAKKKTRLLRGALRDALLQRTVVPPFTPVLHPQHEDRLFAAQGARPSRGTQRSYANRDLVKPCADDLV